MNNQTIYNGNIPPQGAISPFTFQKNIPDALKGVQNKRPEEKLYIVMYYYGDDEKGFELCTGRMECYETIGRLMATYSDLQVYNSVVLVEVLAVNRDNEAEWVLKHPHNAPTIYQFCKNTEKYFPNSDFHIDDYVSADQDDENAAEETEAVSEGAVSTTVSYNDEMTRAYKDILQEKENEDK